MKRFSFFIKTTSSHDNQLNQIFISRNIIFHEMIFPFIKTTSCHENQFLISPTPFPTTICLPNLGSLSTQPTPHNTSQIEPKMSHILPFLPNTMLINQTSISHLLHLHQTTQHYCLLSNLNLFINQPNHINHPLTLLTIIAISLHNHP